MGWLLSFVAGAIGGAALTFTFLSPGTFPNRARSLRGSTPTDIVQAGLVGPLALPVLSIEAVVEMAMAHMPDALSIEIIDPKASLELELIADQCGTKKYKRFAFERASRKAVLLESDRISAALSDTECVTVDIK